MATLHPNLVVLKNKSLRNLFTKIRDQETNVRDFEFYSCRLMTVLAEETVAELDNAIEQVTVHTPCAAFQGEVVDVDKICAVSIVRAGDSLLGCVRAILPGVSVGKILIQRDERTVEKEAKLYYCKLPPKISEKVVILCDPMLATGGSAKKAIESLVDVGVKPSNIIFSNVVCCPEGLKNLAAAYPEVKIVTAAVDECLNEDKYIVPGLGDYGDRFFNTV
ncbi:hypothetical protein TrRE_jg7916 [Triparma retinervis]|uniref:uracil phosphoribosyltransferase n=1 Tax=Triparma retinervis TaxID=2557542 RepID=A0A9W7F4Z6_9STRA|nr:hypothetical protein TrRE_jg7916 [Triparma retinervis]